MLKFVKDFVGVIENMSSFVFGFLFLSSEVGSYSVIQADLKCEDPTYLGECHGYSQVPPGLVFKKLFVRLVELLNVKAMLLILFGGGDYLFFNCYSLSFSSKKLFF